jgi:putative membrane protein
MSPHFKFQKEQVMVTLKGMAMGVADIVPGVSGGTIAFITGIYDQLVESISLVNKDFVKLLLQFKIKQALGHINFQFLFPLMCGIFAAILLGARVMHYLLNEHPVQTWSLFFGLIAASIIYIGKQIEHLKAPKNIATIIAGTLIGYGIVSLIPVHTPNNYLNIFAAGAVAICAMILPGISGSFILLILGKYAFVTGALKQPFIDNHLIVIAVFAFGCLVGLLSFSKLLNWLLKHFHNAMMCFLTGFMIGSMKKIWPWKEVVESKVIRGKTYVLQESNILPGHFDGGFWLAVCLMILGFFLVIGLEKFSKKETI